MRSRTQASWTGPGTGPAADEQPVLHRRTIRLSHADCDPSDILYFAPWFPAMERVQAEWYYVNGFRQDRLLAEYGFSTITRATEAEYLVPVGLFEEIEIRLSLGHMGGTSARSEMNMIRLDDGLQVARGSITLVTLDPQLRFPRNCVHYVWARPGAADDSADAYGAVSEEPGAVHAAEQV